MSSRSLPPPAVAVPFSLGCCLLVFLAGPGHGPARADPPNPLFAAAAGTNIVCSQSNPCNLPTAVFLAEDNQTVYVAGGTYTGTTDPWLAIDEDIRLTGGWDGAASGPVVVDPVANPTVLDGEGARRVIEVTAPVTPVISGVTITRGYHADRGAGIFIPDSPLVQVQDTLFTANHAVNYGAGLFIDDGIVEIRNCRFEGNEVTYGGGGLMLGNDSSASISESTFTGNTASYGTAVDSDNASLTFYNNYVLDNLGPVHGASLNITGSSAWEVTLFNNIIAGNAGDGIKVNQYTLRLYHNTIADNGRDGVSLSFGAHLVLHNNIFSGHTAAGGESVHPGDTGVIDASSNNLFWNNASDPHTGTNPVLGNPLFRGTYHLQPGSAARDAASSSFVTADIDVQARPRGDVPDIGADEFYPEVRPPLLLLLN